ncbi:MAG: hypothetical protein H6620_12775 [Halobacteriovoraceae bacterium]|nr:hypothetical protein [Halobacteriovoraceae bacterium]
MHILRDVLEHARSSQIRLGEEKITGKLRGFLEGDEEIFLNEIKRLGFSASSLDQLTPDITERLGTSQQELLFFRKIGKIHRATWLIKQAREDGHLL